MKILAIPNYKTSNRQQGFKGRSETVVLIKNHINNYVAPFTFDRAESTGTTSQKN